MTAELRAQFLEKVQEEHRDFHPKDVARVNTDDAWLKRFLTHHDHVMESALNMLLETCEWRKNNKVNDLNENTVRRDYLEEGSLFIHNKDKDGKPLLIFKCCKHVKGQKDFEELKKCVIYWFERAERCENADQITIFFDMTNSGMANMDMEYTKYLINLCKQYYPNFLNYILIFEMPWILNATFKIIKSWLPTKAVQKIKFVTKSSLDEYVDKSQSLKIWGGIDPYSFTLIPMDQVKMEDNKKKVHFADGSPLSESSPASFGDATHEELTKTSRLAITPSDAIVFKSEWKEISAVINVKNTSDVPVTYKVKTTSPEKFKVRQGLGMLPVGGEVIIEITLIAGYTSANIVRDKFLILNFPLDSEVPSTSLNECWRSCDTKKLEQHFLKCKVASLTQSLNGTASSLLTSEDLPSPARTDIEEKIAQLLISEQNVSEETCVIFENSQNYLDKKSESSIEASISQLITSMNHVTECCCQLKLDIRFLQRIVVFLTCTTLCFGMLLCYR
ncbi:motile sperm domain-containing protein 2-like isoform X1 [Cimex lectularius]|uniref:Motile sperm domain-containing protein 2 n=1 Tax=Cimex lectularius TaxID=79782 RepID=A0A8I6RDL4_CIMLE|nr:motile sperm domain-containing protein 2-like isoform X1 [Cimex lectularius]